MMEVYLTVNVSGYSQNHGKKTSYHNKHERTRKIIFPFTKQEAITNIQEINRKLKELIPSLKDIQCPVCGSHDHRRETKELINTRVGLTRIKMTCNLCETGFRITPGYNGRFLLHHRVPFKIIAYAILSLYNGKTTRAVASDIQRIYGINITHGSTFGWLKMFNTGILFKKYTKDLAPSRIARRLARVIENKNGRIGNGDYNRLKDYRLIEKRTKKKRFCSRDNQNIEKRRCQINCDLCIYYKPVFERTTRWQIHIRESLELDYKEIWRKDNLNSIYNQIQLGKPCPQTHQLTDYQTCRTCPSRAFMQREVVFCGNLKINNINNRLEIVDKQILNKLVPLWSWSDSMKGNQTKTPRQKTPKDNVVMPQGNHGGDGENPLPPLGNF